MSMLEERKLKIEIIEKALIVATLVIAIATSAYKGYEFLSAKSNEAQQKAEAIQKILGADFELLPEVNGRNMVEERKVRIDFLAYPKKHLIENGFDNRVFGIEAKSIITSATKHVNA